MACAQVFCVHSEPNFSLPWQRKRQYSSTSSGFIISGKRILTNAHSVDHHTQVRHIRVLTVHLCCAVLVLGCLSDLHLFCCICFDNAGHLLEGQVLCALCVQVKVRRRGSDTKFVASVLSIGTECDIAM